MKQLIKYEAVIFALILAASIIGGCLTAGVAVVKTIVEKTEENYAGTDEDGNGIWYRDENGDVVFFGVRFGNSEEVKSGSEIYLASDISALDIEGLSGEVVIEAGDESQISVVYENIPEGYEIRNQEGTLTIHHEGANFIWGMTLTETPKIHVTVPADVTFENIFVDKGSGSLKVLGVTAEILEVDSGSGSTTLSGVVTESLSVDSSSGSVNIADTQTKELSIDSSSGSVTVKNSELGKTSVDISSGSVNFEEVVAENLTVDGSSGRINYVGWLTGNCVFDTASGSVNVELYGEEEDYNVRADMGSGSFYLNGQKTKDSRIDHEDAEHLLVFEASSGRVSLEFKETGR